MEPQKICVCHPKCTSLNNNMCCSCFSWKNISLVQYYTALMFDSMFHFDKKSLSLLNFRKKSFLMNIFWRISLYWKRILSLRHFIRIDFISVWFVESTLWKISINLQIYLILIHIFSPLWTSLIPVSFQSVSK